MENPSGAWTRLAVRSVAEDADRAARLRHDKWHRPVASIYPSPEKIATTYVCGPPVQRASPAGASELAATTAESPANCAGLHLLVASSPSRQAAGAASETIHTSEPGA